MVLDRKKFAKAERQEEIAREEAAYLLRVVLYLLLVVLSGTAAYLFLR